MYTDHVLAKEQPPSMRPQPGPQTATTTTPSPATITDHYQKTPADGENPPRHRTQKQQHNRDDATNYKVTVKVIEKGRPQKSSARNVPYQSVLLQDDKGNKMRRTLFGDQIEAFTDALVYNGIYEVANAPIKTIQEQYRRDPTELPYTMTFGRQTLVRSTSSVPGPVLPAYQCISQIPKTANSSDKFDAIGVCMFVEENARKVPTSYGRESYVREIVVVDHSHLSGVGWSAQGHSIRAEVRNLHERVEVMTIAALKAKKARNTLQDERHTLRVRVPFADLGKDDEHAFGLIQASLQNVPFSIEVAPKTALSRNNILQWALIEVLIEVQKTPVLPNNPVQPLIVHNISEDLPQNAAVAKKLDFETQATELGNTCAPISSQKIDQAHVHVHMPSPDTSLDTNLELIPTNIDKTTQAIAPIARKVVDPTLENTATTTNTPTLKNPKIEKIAVQTPKTHAQSTRKCSNVKEADDLPVKRTKPGTLVIGKQN
ncbi:hypothetical protein KSS87_012336 [Heliosperma pusillum]|nr:hypothetical protein KSS87_012336 [Heliosperma pusillum]